MSTTFVVTRDDIIRAALRALGATDKMDDPDSQDFSDCAFSMNLILKSWISRGMPLWKVVTLTIPLQANVSAYQVGPGQHGIGAITADKPLRILEAFLRNSTSSDIPVRIMARKDYADMGNKFSPGVLNSVYYQPMQDYGIVTVYPPPADNTYTLKAYVQIPLADVTAGTDLLDFPSECYRCFKWNLMDEIAEDYHCSDSKIARIAQKAMFYKEEMECWSQEEASLYLSFNMKSF